MTHSPDRLPNRLDVSSAGQPPHTATPCRLPQQVSAPFPAPAASFQAPLAGALMDASACPGSRNVDG